MDSLALATPSEPSGHIYYFKAVFNNRSYYKLGFTKSASLMRRFSYEGSEDFKYIVKVFLFRYFDNAHLIEQQLHEFLKKQRANYVRYGKNPFYMNGHTEIYHYDVLELDDTKSELETKNQQIYRNNWEEALPLDTEFGDTKDNGQGHGILVSILHVALGIIYFDSKDKKQQILDDDPNYYENRKNFEAIKATLQSRPRIENLEDDTEKNGWVDSQSRQTWYEYLWLWADENNISEIQIPRNLEQLSARDHLCLKNDGKNSYYKNMHIPPEVANLQNVYSIVIPQLGATVIPKELGLLKKLVHLEMHCKLASSFPKEIYDLTNLKTLCICQTGLEVIPRGIAKLVNLKELDLGGNELKCLPKEICSLINLEALTLGCSGGHNSNPLTTLPSSISNLKKLRYLDLLGSNFDSMPMTKIPKVVLELVSLEFLHCDSFCSLDGIVAGIHRLKNLKSISGMVKNERIVGKIIKKLPNLQVYNFRTEDGVDIEKTFRGPSYCSDYGSLYASLYGECKYMRHPS